MTPPESQINETIVLGTVYKPRRQVRGVALMSTLLNKSYLVKVSTKGGGVKNAPNSVYLVFTQPLIEFNRS